MSSWSFKGIMTFTAIKARLRPSPLQNKTQTSAPAMRASGPSALPCSQPAFSISCRPLPRRPSPLTLPFPQTRAPTSWGKSSPSNPSPFSPGQNRRPRLALPAWTALCHGTDVPSIIGGQISPPN